MTDNSLMGLIESMNRPVETPSEIFPRSGEFYEKAVEWFKNREGEFTANDVVEAIGSNRSFVQRFLSDLCRQQKLFKWRKKSHVFYAKRKFYEIEMDIEKAAHPEWL